MTGQSEQEVFNRVVERLMDGTGRAYVIGRGCSYLAADGRKCAVGIFIPDGHRGQQFVGGVGALLEDCPDLRSGPIGTHADILSDLQHLHDQADSWSGGDLSYLGKKRLLALARDYMLTEPAVLAKPLTA